MEDDDDTTTPLKKMVDVSSSLAVPNNRRDIVLLFNDLVRMVTIQIVIQVMWYFGDTMNRSLVEPMFLELIMYICLGVAFYWLIVNRLIGFT